MIPDQLSAAIAAHRRSMFNPIENLEPATLARQLTEFKAGTLRDLALTMDAVEERDDILAGLVPKAKAAVARHGYEINVVERIPAGMEDLAARQKAVLENFWNNITVRSALEPEEEGEFSLLVRQMMNAKGQRYSVHHIVWRPIEGGYTADLIHVPLWFFENRTGQMRFISSPYGYDGVAMDPSAWCVTVGQGIMRACVVAWMFKRMSLQDWVGYCEKFGFPGVHGQTNAAQGSKEFNDMVDAVSKFSRDWSAVTNMEGKINLITAQGGSTLPFPPLVERMDRTLSALWRGADLGTMSAGSGGGQGASLQGDEAAIIEGDDAAWIGETIRRKIERKLLNYVFGEAAPALAYLKVKTSQRQNTELDLKIDAFLVGAGHPISHAQSAERYDRPLPQAGDALLKAAAAAPSPFAASSPLAPTPSATGADVQATALNGAQVAGLADLAAQVANRQLPLDAAKAVAAAAFPLVGAEVLNRIFNPLRSFTPAVLAANEANTARATLFRTEAIQQLKAAQVSAFRPVIERLIKISDLSDEKFPAALETFRKVELPKLSAQILKGDATGDLARAFQSILGSALVSGAAEAAQAKT